MVVDGSFNLFHDGADDVSAGEGAIMGAACMGAEKGAAGAGGADVALCRAVGVGGAGSSGAA